MIENDRAQLKSLIGRLEEQDTLLREGIDRNVFTVSDPNQGVIRRIIDDIWNYKQGLVQSFTPDSDARGLRSTVRDAREILVATLEALDVAHRANSPLQKAVEQVLNSPELIDKRRVFVVFGRNLAARDAMFNFLRAINLDPIEWEEAIAMTGSTSAHVLTAIDQAFSKSQAAVILLTGDDLARLGRTYLLNNDEPHEKELTPQARPNVLFEAGMAFGKFPERTIIVSFGKTRPFTDVSGVHVLHLSDDAESRTRLADRLKLAKCDVHTEHKKDWLKAGDFKSAKHDPDVRPGPYTVGLKVLGRQAEFNEKDTYKHKVRFQIRNDGHECLKIHHSKWKQGSSGIKAKILPGTLQVKMLGKFFPIEHGAERLYLGPGETMQTWIAPGVEYSIKDLENRCDSDGTIGSFVLLVNGHEVELPA